MKTALLSDDRLLLHDTGPSHPERPARITAALKHLKQKEANTQTEKPYTLPPERAPPQDDFFD